MHSKPRFPPIIGLNIGGSYFSTSLTTLCRDPNSMLAKMFSTNIGVLTDQHGNYFIDRDGTHFRYILNYLRDGVLDVPKKIAKELLQEAKFYQLEGMINYLTSLLQKEEENDQFDTSWKPKYTKMQLMAWEAIKTKKHTEFTELKDFLKKTIEEQAQTFFRSSPWIRVLKAKDPHLYDLLTNVELREAVLVEIEEEFGFKKLLTRTTGEWVLIKESKL